MTLAPGTQQRARKAFDLLCEAHSREEFESILFGTPLLLRGPVVQWLADQIDPEKSPERFERLAFLDHLRTTTNPPDYPTGLGPLERIWDRLDRGEISIEQAHQQAGQLSVTESLMGLYVTHLFWVLRDQATNGSDWRGARRNGQVLCTALDACTQRDERALRRARLLGVASWAHTLLTEVPEVRILQMGDEAGRMALEDARASGEQEEIRHMAYELAAMWGDPYVGDKSADESYGMEIAAWRRRGAEELGRIEGLPPDAWAMPEPADALNTSLGYWRVARDAAPDDPTVLIGLVEAAWMLSYVTGEPVPADAETALADGRRLTTEDSDAVLRHRFLAHHTDDGTGAAEALQTLARDSAELVEKHGSAAGRLIMQATGLTSDAYPAETLAGLRRHRDLLSDPAQTEDLEFINLNNQVVRLLNRLEGVPSADHPPADRALMDVIDDVSREIDEESRPRQAATAFLRLALIAAQRDEEIIGLALIEESTRTSPEFASENDWLVSAATAALLEREASNRYAHDERARAIEYYIRALGYFAAVNRQNHVEELLARVADIARDSDEAALIETMPALMTLAPTLARSTNRAVDELQDQIYAGLILGMFREDRLNSELLWISLQVARGLRTAMMVASPRRDLRSEPALAALIQQLNLEYQQATAKPPGSPVPPARTSLRKRFEQIRESLIVRDLPVAGWVALDDARAIASPSTAIIVPYVLREPRLGAVQFCYGVTDNDQALVPNLEPDADLPQALRHLEPMLDQFREAGGDHICWIGPASASPHAVELQGRLVADDWLVTSVPHASLLPRKAPHAAPVSAGEMLSMGVGFANGQRGQAPIPDALDEAQTIARYFGASAVLDDDATVRMLRTGMPLARYVHLATHGRFSSETPSFHELLLTPDADDDGSLFAWEIAELDLEHVELVTLSACASAAIAVDRYGNSEGLPVAFLRAGASTVVGTLWEIETACSRFFFEAMYERLSHDPTRGKAFRSALAATRGRFPDPVDWSAFFLMGDWR